MTRFRVTTRIVAMTAVLVSGLALATAASAVTAPFISVQPLQPASPPANVGLLSVSIASDMPITSLSVDLVAAGGGTPALTLPMSDFTVPAGNGDGNPHTWTLSHPITETQLNLGSYSVEVTAASSDANVSDVPGGTLGFLDQLSIPTFTTSNGTSFNYDNQDVTFTGQAQILTPAGTTQVANDSLDITDTSGDTYPFTTASDGSFSVSVPAKSELFRAEFAGDATTAAATSAQIQISVTQFPVTVNAALSDPHARAGEAVSVIGMVTYDDNGVATPLPGNEVSLSFVPTGGGKDVVATAVTGTNGQFVMAVPTTEGNSITWNVSSTPTTFLTGGSIALPMTVAEPTFIRNFAGTLSAFGVVHVSGCVIATTGTLEVEYAARSAGPWHVLGRWTHQAGKACQAGGAAGLEYSTNFHAKLPSAYYRAVYVANNFNQRAVSKLVHLSRIQTKITSFNVMPRRVPSGGQFTVTGRLWTKGKSGQWLPFTRRHVIVIVTFKGQHYRYASSPITNSHGNFKGKFPIFFSTPVFAQYNGDKTHFACASNRINITKTSSAAAAAAAAALAHLQLVPVPRLVAVP